MKIIPPLTITDAMVDTSNIAEPSATEDADPNYIGFYSAGVTYTVNQIVIVAATHIKYQSLQNGNVGVTPGGAGNETWWLDIGYSDYWKPFDGVVGSQVENTGTITYELDPGRPIDSIALLNIEAASTKVTMTDVGGAGSPIVWDETTLADGLFISDVVKLNFPLTYLTPHIVITLTYTGKTVKLGGIVLGECEFLGLTKYTPTVSITDYSVKNVDTFGNYTVLERAYSKKLSCSTFIANTDLDAVYKALAAYRAKPLVWVGSEDYASMIVYGFYRDFGIDITYPNHSICTLEIEGLV